MNANLLIVEILLPHKLVEMDVLDSVVQSQCGCRISQLHKITNIEDKSAKKQNITK